MTDLLDGIRAPLNRRSFVKKGLMAAGVAGISTGLLTPAIFADSLSQLKSKQLTRNGALSNGDAALLRFVAAAETLEADFWILLLPSDGRAVWGDADTRRSFGADCWS